MTGGKYMTQSIEQLRESEAYKSLISLRSKSKWSLAALMLVVYYGFILIIAFEPEIFATKVGDGHTSLGIVVGLGVILFSFLITGFYVRKANKVFEPLTHEIHKMAEGE